MKQFSLLKRPKLSIEEQYRSLGHKACDPDNHIWVFTYMVRHHQTGQMMDIMKCRNCTITHCRGYYGYSGWMFPDRPALL